MSIGKDTPQLLNRPSGIFSEVFLGEASALSPSGLLFLLLKKDKVNNNWFSRVFIISGVSMPEHKIMRT